MNTYETERLFIRPTTLDDAELNLKSMNTQEFHAYVGDRNIKTLEDAMEYLKNRTLPQIENLATEILH